MRISVSLDTFARESTSSISFNRLSNIPVTIEFTQQGSVVELPSGTQGRLGIKEKYSSDLLAYSSDWRRVGSGSSASYEFDINLNTSEMAAAFAENPNNLAVLFEVSWAYANYDFRTISIAATITNSVLAAQGQLPSSIQGLQATQSEAVDGTSDSKWMSPLKVAQSIVSRIAGLDNAVLHDANDIISVKGVKSATPVTVEVDDATKAYQWVFSSDGHIDVQTNGNQVGYLGTGFYADGQEIYLEKLDPSTGNVVAGNTLNFDTGHGNLNFVFPSTSGTVALTSDVSAAQSASVPLASKGIANGVASLDGSAKVPASQLPSYVDDVLEFATLSAFPATGETGKIYVTTGTNKTYRWSGSTYVEIASSPGSTDAVSEGSTNLYFTAARAIAAVGGSLASYATQAWVAAQGYATSASVTSAVSSAISALVTGVSSVAGKTGAVTLAKADVGLGNVDNTSDANKPVSTATQSALGGKANSSHTHAIADVTGLQTALDGKQVAGSYATAAQGAKADTALQSGTAISTISGLQTALDGKLSLAGTLTGNLNMPTDAVDVVPRAILSSVPFATNGNVNFTMFTPLVNLTVSRFVISSGASSTVGATLVRLGLYVWNEATLTATLVARTSNDTSILSSANTTFTRNFDTTGGYPSSYSLVAGSRYSVAWIIVGATAFTRIPSLVGQSSVFLQTPVMARTLSGQSDLPASTNATAANDTIYNTRLS